MNKEIKFRGKINEKGIDNSWIEGSLVHITKTYKGEEDEQECNIYQIINDDGVGFFIDKETIGQYTGLHDKNGKEIYEGDIITCKQYIGGNFVDYHLEKGFVEFKDGEFGVHREQGYYLSIKKLLEYNYNIEVVGNVFEKGILLNDSKKSKKN